MAADNDATRSQQRLESEPLLVSRDGADDDAFHPRSSSFAEVALLLKICPGLLLGAFVVKFDLSYLATNYSGRIASDLNQLQNAIWIVLAGSISGSCFQPLYAFCANRYSRRSTILAGSSITVVGLLLCSISIWLWELSLSRIFVGMGSSELGLLTTIIINDVVPLTHLALWRSAVTTTMTVGLMLGGPVGSKILRSTNWQIPFFLESLLLAAAIMLLYVTLRLPPPHVPSDVDVTHNRRTEHGNFVKVNFDVVGGGVMILLFATPLLALNMGGGILPWNHPAIITMLAITPVILVVLLYIEGVLAQHPIFPVSFFTSPPVLLANFCAIAVVFAWNQVMFNLSFYTQVRDIDGNLFQNWVLTCVFVGQPIGAFVSGVGIQKTKAVKAILAGSMLLSCLLYSSLAAGWIKSERPAFAPVLLLFGFALGVSESSLTVALFGTVAKQDQAALYALFDLVVAFSGDIGLTVSSSMTRGLTYQYLRNALGYSDEASTIIRKSTASLDYVCGLLSDTRTLVLNSFIYAIQKTFLVSAFIVAAGILATSFLTTSLEEEVKTDEGENLLPES
ncbi:MFS general substrate transporter [Cadophora sp. DSE1049]|nr:MFS general substrate transporter [Cadophora sp. DSE1049]